MNKAVLLHFFFILLLSSPSARANFFEKTWDEVASPITTDAKYILMGGSALTTFLVIDNVDNAETQILNETKEDKPLGPLSKYGDLAGQMVPNAIYIAANYAICEFGIDSDDRCRRSLLMLKATVYSGVLANVIKYTVREKRPDSNNRDSFPSGHTTSAFAFASIIATEHSWYWGTAAYTMATLVGFSRMNDNAHRLHDVVAGATLGISYGLGLHFLYKDEKSQIAHFSLAPYSNGLSIGYHTEF